MLESFSNLLDVGPLLLRTSAANIEISILPLTAELSHRSIVVQLRVLRCWQHSTLNEAVSIPDNASQEVLPGR